MSTGASVQGEVPLSIPVDLLADGLLWAVNTSVMHPRGYALAYDPKTRELTLQGDGTERWSFAEDEHTAKLLDGRWEAFTELLARAAKANTPGGTSAT